MSNLKMGRRIPVQIVTGSLGSGKTSLLADLLSRELLIDAAIVMCEYGEIALDHHIIRPLSDGPVELINGCPCCIVHDDIINAMEELWIKRNINRELQFQSLIIETSGVTDPLSIIITLLSHPSLKYRYQIAGVVCILDALIPYDNGLPNEVESQICLADRFVITKTDLIDSNSIEDVLLGFKDIEDMAPMFIAPVSQEEAKKLLEPRRYEYVSRDNVRRRKPMHAIIVETWRSNHAVKLSELQKIVRDNVDRNGHQLLRTKGVVNIVEQESPIILHTVGHHVFPIGYVSDGGVDGAETAINIFARGGGEKCVDKLVDSLEQLVRTSSEGN